MKTGTVDLHCHSTASDGTLSPSDVVRLAAREGLSGLALTDHDTADGVAEAAAEAAKLGIDFIPGIELSCAIDPPGTMHLLGYGIDPSRKIFREMVTTLLSGRDTRNPRIIARLNELNVAISMDEVNNEAGGQVIGRPHIAAILVRKGYVSSIKNAFDKYLAPGGLAWFDKERLTFTQAIDMVKKAGGIAVLAHPIQLRTTNDAQLQQVVKDLVDAGLSGIETLHSDQDEKWTEKLTVLAREYNLLTTGGSDFHGTNKKDINLGWARGRRIPREFFDRLKERLAQVRVSEQQPA